MTAPKHHEPAAAAAQIRRMIADRESLSVILRRMRRACESGRLSAEELDDVFTRLEKILFEGDSGDGEPSPF